MQSLIISQLITSLSNLDYLHVLFQIARARRHHGVSCIAFASRIPTAKYYYKACFRDQAGLVRQPPRFSVLGPQIHPTLQIRDEVFHPG
jgi:hypothetical protein